MTDEPTTYIRPEYRLCSGRHTVAGVLFVSYSVGISNYARITEDGKIMIRRNGSYNTYSAYVIGHGVIKTGNKPKKFRSDTAACIAGIALFQSLQAMAKASIK